MLVVVALGISLAFAAIVYILYYLLIVLIPVALVVAIGYLICWVVKEVEPASRGSGCTAQQKKDHVLMGANKQDGFWSWLREEFFKKK